MRPVAGVGVLRRFARDRALVDISSGCYTAQDQRSQSHKAHSHDVTLAPQIEGAVMRLTNVQGCQQIALPRALDKLMKQGIPPTAY